MSESTRARPTQAALASAGAARVAFWGVGAMACTALDGRLFGTSVQ